MTDSSSTPGLKLQAALQKLIALTAENVRLRTENKALKNKLSNWEAAERPPTDCLAESTNLPYQADPPQITSTFSKNDKVSLFRSLVRGRDDVYPVRWENKQTGKSGYSPALKNKWEYLDAKKRGDKSVAPEYLPLSDDVILQHLEGKIVAGVYALLKDETCHFLAVDFDDDAWEMERAYTELFDYHPKGTGTNWRR